MRQESDLERGGGMLDAVIQEVQVPGGGFPGVAVG